VLAFFVGGEGRVGHGNGRRLPFPILADRERRSEQDEPVLIYNRRKGESISLSYAKKRRNSVPASWGGRGKKATPSRSSLLRRTHPSLRKRNREIIYWHEPLGSLLIHLKGAQGLRNKEELMDSMVHARKSAALSLRKEHGAYRRRARRGRRGGGGRGFLYRRTGKE